MGRHFVSPHNRDPALWGKVFWDFIFVSASNYPHGQSTEGSVAITPDEFEIKKRQFVVLIKAFTRSIPCDVCRRHFREYMRKNPLSDALESRERLFLWLYRAKCDINRKRKRRNTSYNVVLRNYNIPPMN